MLTMPSGWPISGSSSSSLTCPEDEVLSCLVLLIGVFQVPGESAAWPAQPAGGAAEVSAAAAQPGRLRFFCWNTLTGISCKNAENTTVRQET